MAAVAATLTTACDSSGTATSGGLSDKVGNPPPPITLTLVTSLELGRPGVEGVERFVSAVDQLSDGRVKVVPTYDHPFEQLPAWDQANITALRDGEFDMAVVSARAWRSAGVMSLEPLQLPFVIENDEQADRVVTDPALTEALLAGLADAGVSGLGLYPEGSRHLVRLDGGPINPAGKFDGLTVRAPLSTTTWTILRTLGADVVDVNGNELTEVVRSGSVDSADTSLALIGSLPTSGTPSVLVNVALYYKFNVLAISHAALSDLDDQTVDVLRGAAQAGLEESVATRTREAAALEDACALGLSTTFASDRERVEFRGALTPAIDRIIEETGIGPLVERVVHTAGEASREQLSGCPTTETAEATQSVDPADLKPVAGALPNGIYRFEVDADIILTAYPNFPRSVKGYSGVFTVELDDGHYTLDVISGDGSRLSWTKVYEVDGDVVTLAFPSGTDFDIPMAVRWRWHKNGDGSLSFQPLNTQDRGERVDYTDLLTVPPWKPIA